MIKFSAKEFSDLTLDELYDLLKLRQEVFIVEQDCPYLDSDGLDQDSLHILGYLNESIVAYARILPKGIQYENYAAIGRVVSSQTIRKQKVGSQLFDFALKKCIDIFPNDPIKLSSQVYIKQFYASFGFVEKGEPYLEDDIPHIAMTYEAHLQ